MEAVGHEVSVDFCLVGLGIVVTIEIEDPVCVQVRMYGHVKSVRGKLRSVALAIVVLYVGIAGVAAEY